MLRNETIQKLKSLRLSGFAEALQEQYKSEEFDLLSFDERLGLLIDRECAKRESNRLKRLISNAHFKNSQASIEDLYYEPLRKLDRSLVLELASCNYIVTARMSTFWEQQALAKATWHRLWVLQPVGQDSESFTRSFRNYLTNSKSRKYAVRISTWRCRKSFAKSRCSSSMNGFFFPSKKRMLKSC